MDLLRTVPSLHTTGDTVGSGMGISTSRIQCCCSLRREASPSTRHPQQEHMTLAVDSQRDQQCYRGSHYQSLRKRHLGPHLEEGQAPEASMPTWRRLSSDDDFEHFTSNTQLNRPAKIRADVAASTEIQNHMKKFPSQISSAKVIAAQDETIQKFTASSLGVGNHVEDGTINGAMTNNTNDAVVGSGGELRAGDKTSPPNKTNPVLHERLSMGHSSPQAHAQISDPFGKVVSASVTDECGMATKVHSQHLPVEDRTSVWELKPAKRVQVAVSSKKKYRRRRRLLDPLAFRKEMCDLFRRSEVKLKVWYALIALYVAEWPQYAHRDRGGDLYIQNMRQRAQNFKVPACATLPVQMRFGEELNCGTNVVFLEGLDRVAPGIHNLEDLNAILRRQAKNPDFANLIQHTQTSKVPIDISIEGFPMLLRTAFEGFAFTFGRKLFLRKGTKVGGEREMRSGVRELRVYTGYLSKNDLYSNSVEQYHQHQLQYWMLLLMTSVLKHVVSRKPQAGVIIFELDCSFGSGTSTSCADISDSEHFSLLQKSIANTIKKKLKRAFSRFEGPPQSGSEGLVALARTASLPVVYFTGYIKKLEPDVFAEEGVPGMDIASERMEKIKEQMKLGAILIGISLVDPWSFKPISEWPNPIENTILALTAYTATQLLCSEVQWDPTLGDLGLVKVVFTEVYDVDPNGWRYTGPQNDPDVQVLLLRNREQFIKDGSKEGNKKKIFDLISREPLQWGSKRFVDEERILWRGSARLSDSGQILRGDSFGHGLPFVLRRRAEELLEPNVVLIHLSIKGLGRNTSDSTNSEMTANEMAGRLVRRSRGLYDSILLKTEPLAIKSLPVKIEANCNDAFPLWVAVVSCTSVAIFFIAIITMLMYHRKLRLPWWIICICSNKAPWEWSGSPTDVSSFDIPEAFERSFERQSRCIFGAQI